jgi:hypothetical protein
MKPTRKPLSARKKPRHVRNCSPEYKAASVTPQTTMHNRNAIFAFELSRLDVLSHAKTTSRAIISN